ncbi:MAG: DUF805 domain-containing protein [Pseudomonadota bacterium]
MAGSEAPSLTWLFFSRKGRIARQSYTLAVLFLILPQFFLLYKIGMSEGNTELENFWLVILFIAGIVTLWSTIALAVKRLHDIDMTGWLAILTLLPTISWIFVVGLMFIPTKPVDNEHGPPPFARN